MTTGLFREMKKPVYKSLKSFFLKKPSSSSFEMCVCMCVDFLFFLHVGQCGSISYERVRVGFILKSVGAFLEVVKKEGRKGEKDDGQ